MPSILTLWAQAVGKGWSALTSCAESGAARFMRSGTRPAAADLVIDGGVVRAERYVQAHVNAVLPGYLIAEPEATGRDRLDVVEALEIVPRYAAAREAFKAEAFPELPAELADRTSSDLLQRHALICGQDQLRHRAATCHGRPPFYTKTFGHHE